MMILKLNLMILNKMNSIKLIKDLIKTKSVPRSGNLRPGNFLIYKYNAKDKKRVFDKTPLVFVLRVSKSYMLGLNLHWLPLGLRKTFVKIIFKLNSSNIRKSKPLEVDYYQLKPFLKKFGMVPVIRLYIKSRISQQVVKIPNENIVEICQTKSETFSGGIPAEKLYRMAKRSKI